MAEMKYEKTKNKYSVAVSRLEDMDRNIDILKTMEIKAKALQFDLMSLEKEGFSFYINEEAFSFGSKLFIQLQIQYQNHRFALEFLGKIVELESLGVGVNIKLKLTQWEHHKWLEFLELINRDQKEVMEKLFKLRGFTNG
ncbi:MAG: hypothetical protein AB8E15_00085 [Bdellovibrionales bacterium]